MRRTAEKGSSRKPGFRQILFSEIQWTERAGAPTAPVPRVSFALGPLDKVWRPRRHSLRVFALAVTSYTGTVRHGKGPVYTLYGLFYERLLTRDQPFQEGTLQSDRPGASCSGNNLAGFGRTGPHVLKTGRGYGPCNGGVP